MAKEIKKTVLWSANKLNKKFEGHSQNVIQVVQFNDAEPMLIKQQYYKDEDGNWMPGKFRGFTYEDLRFMKKAETRKEVFDALQGK